MDLCNKNAVAVVRKGIYTICFLSLLTLSVFALWSAMNFLQSAFIFNSILVQEYSEKQPVQSLEPQELSKKLLEVYEQIVKSFESNKSPILTTLEDIDIIAAQIYPPVNIDILTHSKKNSVVCLDQNLLSNITYILGTSTCAEVQPLKDLITVIVNVQELSNPINENQAIQLLKDFYNAYPGMKIIVIDSGKNQEELSKVQGLDMSFVTLLEPKTDSRSDFTGIWWNAAVSLVKTPFVFIAIDITSFSKQLSPLDRILRVLIEVPGVGAVGGAIRNDNSQWKVACFQSTIKNYVLKYENGYHFSRNGSMFCDYVDGPFVTYTHLMKEIVLSDSLESDVVFQDFFLKLNRDWLSMACPDIKFYGNGRMSYSSAILLRGTWFNFAQKWELNRIAINLQNVNVVHKYSCRDVGINCGTKIISTDYYAIPVCCLEAFSRAMGIFAEFCDRNKMSCQFDSGTCLGAVKMANVMPWDRDGDGIYPEMNYSFIKSKALEFETNGIQFGNFEEPVCYDSSSHNCSKLSYFQAFVLGMDFELWGMLNIPYDTFLYGNGSTKIDNKMKIHDMWVGGPPNPGYYARQRYGHECLRHAPSWRYTGKTSSWEPYETGNFIKCKNREHHACLNRFSADGDINFMVPE